MQTSRSLMTTEELAAALGDANLRIFDCTTYLEPLPPGSDSPYAAVPGRHTFEAGHIPGADFLDLQGEFSDASTQLRFMMPKVAQLEEAFGRHGMAADSKVVLYSIGSNMWATRFWWMLRSLGLQPQCSTAASTSGSPRDVRSSAVAPAIRRRPSRPRRHGGSSSTNRRC